MAQSTPQASLDAIFKADPTKNTIFVQALNKLSLYSTYTSRTARNTIFAPTDAVSMGICLWMSCEVCWCSRHLHAGMSFVQLWSMIAKIRSFLIWEWLLTHVDTAVLQAFQTLAESLGKNVTSLLADSVSLRVIVLSHITSVIIDTPENLAATTTMKMLSSKNITVDVRYTSQHRLFLVHLATWLHAELAATRHMKHYITCCAQWSHKAPYLSSYPQLVPQS